MAHPDLPAEQAYVDDAYAALDRMRETLERSPAAAATEVAAEAIEAWAARRLRHSPTPSAGSASAGSTSRASRDPLYVGRRWVHDDDQRRPRRQLAGARGAAVLHGDARRAARRHAAPALPHRGPRLLDISDEALDGSLEDAASARRRLPARGARARPRRAHARHRRHDPGRPVPADCARPGPPLVVQGGPGTGKTAVGLHRASYLLYTHRARAPPRARRRAEPDLHGLRLARPADARRGERRAAGGHRARRRASR